MHQSHVSDALGIIGGAVRYEVETLCFLKHTLQEARIQAEIDEKTKLQTDAMHDMIKQVHQKLGIKN